MNEEAPSICWDYTKVFESKMSYDALLALPLSRLVPLRLRYMCMSQKPIVPAKLNRENAQENIVATLTMMG